MRHLRGSERGSKGKDAEGQKRLTKGKDDEDDRNLGIIGDDGAGSVVEGRVEVVGGHGGHFPSLAVDQSDVGTVGKRRAR